MMLEIVPLVRHLVPGLLGDSQASVVCVCATQPKYLVFNAGDASRPACVVEWGEPARLTRIERVLGQLSAAMPGLVPAPIACTAWRNGRYVLIQEGLHGTPWFRVADRMRTEADWRALLSTAVATLVRLHRAVREVPEWTGRVSVGAELERQTSIARRTGVPLSLPAFRRARELAGAAGTLPVASWWQHGDFALNNLLVGDHSMAIIDFDEFGRTMVPLHDVFGLALSFTLSQSGAEPLSRLACLTGCVAEAAAGPFDRTSLAALFLHHCLFRINQCAGLEARAKLRRVLIGWTEEFARTPEAFLG